MVESVQNRFFLSAVSINDRRTQQTVRGEGCAKIPLCVRKMRTRREYRLRRIAAAAEPFAVFRE